MKERQRGFTLTEIMVAVAIFAIIFIAALMIYDRSNQLFKSGVVASDAQQSTRVAFDKLVSDLRMAGFDYDRDGRPISSSGGVTQYQQPDEPIEYIGRSAISFRANLDYEDDPTNGREAALESAQFPVVTTGNDEIVTYALESDDSSANTDSITFYADTDVPRDVHPDAGGAEDQVTITGVDLSNDNPPYTLYRYTLADDGSIVKSPVASNIRSLQFTYFEDQSGSTLLTDVTGTTQLVQDDLSTTVGGKGQYDSSNPTALLQERAVRSKIRSVQLEIVGMHDDEDPGYTDPDETLAAAQNYRKVRLDTMVTPRNLGMRGMREQSTKPPGPPTMDDVCFGLCGMALLEWAPKGATGVYGDAEQFQMMYDFDAVGDWNDGGYTTNLFGIITGLDPATTYYFAIRALNGFGSALSSAPYESGIPTNTTKPEPSSNLGASIDQPGVIYAQWNGPTDHVAGKDTLACASGAVKPAPFRTGEIDGYQVKRSTDPAFDPASAGQLVADVGSPSVNVVVANNTITFSDTTAAPCKKYFYRVRAVEQDCVALGPDAYSEWFPAVGTDGVTGMALSTGNPPNAPITLAVDQANSTFDGAANLYKIKLDWPAVTADTTGTPIGVDDYVIYRQRRVWSSANPWVDDPLPAPAPQKTGALADGSTVTFIDSTAEYKDPGTGLVWEYRYTVAAQTCSDVGAASPDATYPPNCVLSGSSVIQAGASSGSGTQADPWVMDTGDGVEVLPPAGDALSDVVFNLYDSSGNLVDTVVDSDPTDSFLYGWTLKGNTDVYSLVMTITNTANCSEMITKYITDLTIAPCTVLTAAPVQTSSVSGGGNKWLQTYTLKIDNTGNENLNLDSIVFTWTNNSGGNASLDSLKIGNTTVPSPPAGAGTHTVNVPAGTLSVTPADQSYFIEWLFQTQANKGTLTAPISKVCIRYTISSEPGVLKSCNVHGGSGTANPGACD